MLRSFATSVFGLFNNDEEEPNSFSNVSIAPGAAGKSAGFQSTKAKSDLYDEPPVTSLHKKRKRVAFADKATDILGDSFRRVSVSADDLRDVS